MIVQLIKDSFYVQILLFVILFLTINYVILTIKSIRYEKKFNFYALNYYETKDNSLGDKIYNFIWKFILNVSSFINKIPFIKKYALRYDKYANYKDEREGIDYISLKIIFSFITVILAMTIFKFKFTIFNIIIYLMSLLGGFLFPNIYLKLKYYQKCHNIKNDFYKSLIILKNSFESNCNLNMAIKSVIKSNDGDIRFEYSHILNDLKCGLTIDKAFLRLKDRIRVDEINFMIDRFVSLTKVNEDYLLVLEMVLEETKENSAFKKENVLSTLFLKILSVLFIMAPLIITIIYLKKDAYYFDNLYNNSYGMILCLIFIIIYLLYLIIINFLFKAGRYYEK